MAGPNVDFGRLSGVLFGVCFCSAALLVGFNTFTEPIILENQAKKTKRARVGVLPEGTKTTDKKGAEDGRTPFTVDLSEGWDEHRTDLVKILDRDQEKARALEVFRGYDESGEVTGYAMVCELPDGYSGTIRFMLGVRYDPAIDGFRVSGAKILVHKETPGLGANIVAVDWDESQAAAEEDREPVPNHLAQYRGRTVDQLGLKKDGVEDGLDALTAATITTRAFANAVTRILQMANRNASHFLAPGGEGAEHASRPTPTQEGRG